MLGRGNNGVDLASGWKKRSATRGARVQSVVRDVDLGRARARYCRISRMNAYASALSADAITADLAKNICSGFFRRCYCNSTRLDGLGASRDWNCSGPGDFPSAQRRSQHGARTVF